MPKKLERCVRKVKAKGKDESSAYAICSKSTGWKKAGKHSWRKESIDYFTDLTKAILESGSDDGPWTKTVEAGHNVWSIELSTLDGIGYQFPTSFKTTKKVNLRKFTPVRTQDEDNEITQWEYTTNKNNKFIVWND